NWGIIPTLGSSYDFRDGRLNANFELPLQWGIFKLGPSVGIEYKGENINFNILIKGEVNF
ncbi:MAG: hypothetical protein QXY64_04200, partial [Candidatus Bilamarchaeaceae archaeon]